MIFKKFLKKSTMDRLSEIQNEYARKIGFSDWGDLLKYQLNQKLIHRDYNEVSKTYAKECVKASLEKASENARVMTKNIDTENELEVLSWTDSRNIKFSVSKQSILNEDNIVLV